MTDSYFAASPMWQHTVKSQGKLAVHQKSKQCGQSNACRYVTRKIHQDWALQSLSLDVRIGTDM